MATVVHKLPNKLEIDMKKIQLLIFTVLLTTSIFARSGAYAAGDAVHIPEQKWSFDGIFGTYDRAAMQRGFLVYKQVCSACHGMKHLAYRNLEALGYNENQLKNIAAEYTVEDGPNDEGEMFERAALPSDRFVNPYPNEKAAKAANNGAYPPDLSLITKARVNGSNYVYAILTGYEEAPEGKELMTGQYWNKYMSGHVIAMPPQLSDGMVAYEDGTPETAEQYARDVAHFLTWAASPYKEDQKRIGLRVILFLMVFAGIMYAVKRRLWASQH